MPADLREVVSLGLLPPFMEGTPGKVVSCIRYDRMTKETARRLCAGVRVFLQRE